MEGLFDHPEVIRGVIRITRNPFFWGVGTFAVAHIVMIGEAAAAIAFGSVAFLGLVGAPILDAKKAGRHGASWVAFAAATSDIPFLAIAQGRQRLALREIGLWRLAAGTALFVVALAFHRLLFGGSPIGSF